MPITHQFSTLDNVAQKLGYEPARLYSLFHKGIHPCWHLIHGEFFWNPREWNEILDDPELDLDLSD
jgi:hypothetical protein